MFAATNKITTKEIICKYRNITNAHYLFELIEQVLKNKDFQLQQQKSGGGKTGNILSEKCTIKFVEGKLFDDYRIHIWNKLQFCTAK